VLDDSGIEIDLGGKINSRILEVSLDHDDAYQIEYRSNGHILSEQIIPTAHLFDPGGLSLRTISVLQKVVRNGYDSIRIYPLYGEEKFCFGHVHFLD